MGLQVKPTRWLTVIITVTALTAAGFFLMPRPHATSAAENQPEQETMVPANFTQLAQQAGPAVVNIRTVKTVDNGGQVFRHFFGPQGPNEGSPFDDFFDRFFDQQDPREFKQRSLGSGFILDRQGHIVTNNHVIENADQIQVKLKNGNEYDAQLIGTDPNTDLALIKIEADEKLPTLELGDSRDMKIGQWVVAIGNPFGLEHTVTAGIVSAKGRVIGAGPYDDFIQTDASINPGNSGGPLLNMNGEVIGINTAIVAGGKGIGFAIPSGLAKNVITELKESGEVTRGWLGVAIQELNDELKQYYDVNQGVMITQVFKGDPADKAGIKPNDIITEVNDKPVDSPRDLSRRIAGIKPGQKAEIKLIREGKTRTFNVEVAKREEEKLAERGRGQAPGSMQEAELGLDVTDLNQEMARQLNLKEIRGVIVTQIARDSKAAEAGFQKGDIIREINHEKIGSVTDFKKMIQDAESGQTLAFYVLRPRQGITVIKLTK
jgi:serine protease Do